MGMERRVSPRMPVTLDVVLNHHSQSVICTIKDISLGGAFIDAEPELLPYAGTIELGFTIPAETDPQHVRLPATIRRITDKGAAVTFGDISHDVYFRLVDLVTGAAPAR